LESGDIKEATALLVQSPAAVETYPKAAEGFRPVFTAIARKLNNTNFSNIKVQTERTPGADLEIFKRLRDEFKNAEFDPATNTLYIRRDRATSTTVLHELIHAGTVQTIRQYELDKSKLTDVQRQGVERLMSTFEVLQNQADDISLMREFPQAFESVYEFIAIGLSEPRFQSRLARIEVPVGAEAKNLWTEFVKAIAKLFNLNVQPEGKTTALNEVGQAFSEILAAPTSEGVTGVKPLAEKERKKAEKKPKDEIENLEAEVRKQAEATKKKSLTLKGLAKYLLSAEAGEKLIENFQDQTRPLVRRQTDLDRAGWAIWASAADGGNTLAAANDMSAGQYQNFAAVIAPLLSNNTKAVEAYAARKGISFEDAKIKFDTFAIAEAVDVRRLTNYLKQVPLSTKSTIRLASGKVVSPAQLRDDLINSVMTMKPLDDKTRDAVHNRLMQLAGVEIGPNGQVRDTKDADKYRDKLGASYNETDRGGKARIPGERALNYDDASYDIIEGLSVNATNKVLAELNEEKKLFGNEIKAIRESLVELDKIAMKFNEEANFLTQPAKNLIKLYGWGDKYVPLVGKVSKEYKKTEQALYANTTPNEILPGFRGRETLPDSPILISQINAGKAATRAARAEIVPTLVNLMKPHPKTKKKYVKGNLVGTITFAERYKGEINFDEGDGAGGKKWIGKDKFYNYLENGDIEVWKVNDEDIIRSLRPEWTPSKTLIERGLSLSQSITSLIGQGHTRYQPKFAPYDFPRNVFANAGAIATELGSKNATKYFASVGRATFVEGRLPQVWRIASAHFDGDFDKIKKIGGFNPQTKEWKDPFVQAAFDYLQRGGKVSIVRSWATRNKIEELIAEAEKSDWRKNAEKYKAAVDKYFDLWLDGFELVARIQAFRVAKSYAMNERDMNNNDAEVYAVSLAKNLANFEKKGLKKAPAALYAFWNPAATGAVRAFEAITPAMRIGFNPKNVEKILDELPDEIKNDPEARANYAKRYLQLARNGQGAIAFYGAVGFMMYMMALSLGAVAKGVMGDDEEDPVNAVTADSKELWTRNLRLPLEWLGIPTLKEKFFQIPWGFGIGAFAAAGAQTAALATGGQTLKDYLGNITTIGADSFLPLPVARYNPMNSPFNWLMSSVLPTYLRPFYEYNVNMSGLGNRIYRDYYNRFGPAMAGSENIEEMYRYLAILARDVSDGRNQYDPSEIRFYATAYFDGVAAIMADLVNIGLTAKGDKDFDPKTDLVFLDNFIGNKISPDLIKYGKARDRIEKLKRGYNSAINSTSPAFRDRFLKNNPNAPAIVYLYNQLSSDLSQFSSKTKEVEAMADTPRERKELVKENNKTRDILMRQMAALYEQYQEDIDDYY
jgi:hypothetical protein